MNALIFIDTNILLDFYRIRKSEVSMKYIEHIGEHKARIITGTQIEMEYKKNRQKVILESLGQFKNPQWNNLSVPALLSESHEATEIDKLKQSITEQQQIINKNIENILKDPLAHDPVFTSLNTLFNNHSSYNLHKRNPETSQINEKALKRFMLGYPPRKENDTSIGDAINWEWIVHCASKAQKNIIIVTRDSDYGASIKEDAFINDWLYREFKDRVGEKFDIVLTQKLSKALKLIDVQVSDEMVSEEENMIKHYEDLDLEQEEDSVTRKIFDILKKHNY
ncbi:MAG: hypothetical protein A2Y23_05100 [Clostridiales bacterium GWB2_37_7]|nr:MAG: hypothetical protein A2Y23_05100 [Clostridiales bacterium GWB2_37_7]